MRILWLKTELLHPIDKGGKIRTYQMLRELKKTNHITYLCLDDGSSEADALAGRLAAEPVDHSVGLLYLEMAQEALDIAARGDQQRAKVAAAVVRDVMPRYLEIVTGNTP